jgi:hypothetical protein
MNAALLSVCSPRKEVIYIYIYIYISAVKVSVIVGCDVALGDNQIPKFRRNVQTLSLRVKKFCEIEFF